MLGQKKEGIFILHQIVFIGDGQTYFNFLYIYFITCKLRTILDEIAYVEIIMENSI